MYKKMQQSGTRLALILGALFSVLFLLGSLMFSSEAKSLLNGVNHIDFGIFILFLMIITLCGITLFYWVKKVKKDIGDNKLYLKISGGAVLVFIILFLINRFTSDGSLERTIKNHDISPNISSFISAGILMTFISLMVAVVAIFYFEIKKSIR